MPLRKQEVRKKRDMSEVLDLVGETKDTRVVGLHSGLTGRAVFHDGEGEILLPKSSGHLEVQIWGGSQDKHAIVDLSNLKRFNQLRIFSKRGGSVSIGPMTTIEQWYFLADSEDIKIGSDCMISFGGSFRTTDAHGIYDIQSGDRLNKEAGISIGDHVWVGQGCTIAKGVTIGMSSVIGAFSFASNSILERNSIFAGTPVRKLKSGITWDRRQCDNIFDEHSNVDPFFAQNINKFIGKREETEATEPHRTEVAATGAVGPEGQARQR